jgi:FlaA1/EpsC-like NDP-sugar epimerase
VFVPIAVVIHVLTNSFFGLYGQMWRYASVEEARRVVFSGAMAGVLVVIAATQAWAMVGTRPLPMSVVVLGAALSLVSFGVVRFQTRLFAFQRRSISGGGVRVLIVGAGEAGAMILRDLVRNRSMRLQPVGLVDDDPRKVGRSLNGVQVLGRRAQIPALAARFNIDQVLLAIPSASRELVRDVAELCEQAEVSLRILPSLEATVHRQVTVSDIRELRIEDLLGRVQVETDLEGVAAVVRDKRVMITGAGGSIGSEITRQVAGFHPSALILLDHDETHLHDTLTDLDATVPAEYALADIRDRARVYSIFGAHRPDVIFHAAAHKHVPLLETHPQEALQTNMIGTANVADAALASGAQRFVLISTDKAIHPTSVMGASKRLAEHVVRALDGRGCVFCAVRFGNVLGSRGSVVPTFLRQIARGGPVTVTDPSMSRYFMSTREAVQLVLQATALSRGGEVFTLDMGEPVNILDLARKLVRMAGRVPYRDVDIAIIGPRPGEKLVEEVRDGEEEQMPSAHPSIVVSQPPLLDRAALRAALQELEILAGEGLIAELGDRMKSLAVAARDVVREDELLWTRSSS